MLGSPTLLSFNKTAKKDFEEWLKKLGLESFLKEYPIEILIEWGWLRPVRRVVFPPSFFEEWEDYPYPPWYPSPEMSGFAELWDYRWGPDEPSTNLWFLDPAFRVGEPISDLLNSFEIPEIGTAPPGSIKNSTGIEISPYVDCFYRWQGYALIDVICSADCVPHVYRTPDMIERVKEVKMAAEYLSIHSSKGPTEALTSIQRWGGLAEPMTWLAHFWSFRDALYRSNIGKQSDSLKHLYELGAREMAHYFGFTHTSFCELIQNKILVLAEMWMAESRSSHINAIWTKRAWEYLRAEVQLAISWLMILSGNDFSYYIDKWKHPYLGSLGWAALEEVLPYGFVEHDKRFSRIVPHYIGAFNALVNNQWAMSDSKILELCRGIRKRNYPFGGFLAAFYELHENLAHRNFDDHGLDFRELRPLDYFGLLAIQAEGCLRRELDSLDILKTIKGSSQTLSRYIEELARVRGLPSRLIGSFSENKKLADLKQDRRDPIGRIKALRTNLPEHENQLVQGLLCCVLARNYFAHHDFLDKELMARTPLPGFLLGGIVLSVLVLLDLKK